MKKNFFRGVWLAVMMGLLITSAYSPVFGASIPVINPSFEDDTPPGNGWGTGPQYGDWNTIANGWSIEGLAGTFIPNELAYPNGLPLGYGNHIAFADSGGSALVQTFPAYTLTAGYNYTLQVAVGHRINWGFPGYHVQLWAGNSLLEDLEVGGPATPAEGQFEMVALYYTATSGSPRAWASPSKSGFPLMGHKRTLTWFL